MAKQPTRQMTNDEDAGVDSDQREQVILARQDLMSNPQFRASVTQALRDEIRPEVEASIRAELEEEIRNELEREIAGNASKEMRDLIARDLIKNSKEKLMKTLNRLAPELNNFAMNSAANLSKGEPKWSLREEINGLVLNREGHISVISLISSMGNWIFGEKIVAVGNPPILNGFAFKPSTVLRKKYVLDPSIVAEHSFLDRTK